MPLPDHAILTEHAGAFRQHQFEVRWSSLVHARHDTFGMNDEGTEECGDGHRTVVFVFSIQLLAEDRAIFEAWLEFPKGRRMVLPRQPLSCVTSHDKAMLHVDCTLDGRRLIVLSISDDGRIAYAQSDLMAEAGFRGGTYDPPTARQLKAGRGAASA